MDLAEAVNELSQRLEGQQEVMLTAKAPREGVEVGTEKCGEMDGFEIWETFYVTKVLVKGVSRSPSFSRSMFPNLKCSISMYQFYIVLRSKTTY